MDIIYLVILFLFINVGPIVFIKKYLKIDNKDKLGIHCIIIIMYIILDVYFVFTFLEILLSEECLLYKLIPKKYFIVKIIKVIFSLIGKNSIMLVFLLINRAYCILFFDNQYRNKYIKLMILIGIIDYLIQLCLTFFTFLDNWLLDIYNILYYLILGIYIYMRGSNISIFLILLMTLIENNNIETRTQEEMNNIREIIDMKKLLRRQTIIVCFLFCLIGILSPFLYLLFSLKGNTVYDLIHITQLSLAIFLISIVFYPKQLLKYFKITYEQLINGIPQEFLNEYLFKFNDDHYIKNDFKFNILYKSPIVILNHSVKNGINKFKNVKNDQDIMNQELINSFFVKGQIGFLSNIN